VEQQSKSIPDDAFQAQMLAGTSRTFALTIPQLPPGLSRVVANAYLLCRIVDTVEDEPALSAELKRRFCAMFVDAVAGTETAERFSAELSPLLSSETIPAVHRLIKETPRVIAITHGFTPAQQDALRDCVRVMGQGMAQFQDGQPGRGLRDLPELDRYCYHVAGVVGEMLTRLFCEHSSEIARHKTALMQLAVRFGQGLQMTNILKDVWDDLERGACWLPRDVFAQTGFDLGELAPGRHSEGFGRGMQRLVGIARGHLEAAVRYTLLIPARETGIRNFCLWAIGMAVLTLRNIHRRIDFQAGDEVKISRRSVKATVLTSRLSAGWDPAVKLLFRIGARGLPSSPAPGAH